MPVNIQKILRQFKQELTRLYGDRIRSIYLFGSYARGDYEPGSDLDVLIVLDTFRYYNKEISRTADLVSDLSLQYLITVSPMFARERDWLLGKKPLIRNVKNEGIKLYERRKRLASASGGRGN
jgi:type I restriction enzyme S subunit